MHRTAQKESHPWVLLEAPLPTHVAILRSLTRESTIGYTVFLNKPGQSADGEVFSHAVKCCQSVVLLENHLDHTQYS